MKRLDHFAKTMDILSSNDLTIEEAKLKVEMLKELNRHSEIKNDRLQRVLDWWGQPLVFSLGKPDIETATAIAIVTKGYWEGIAAREQARTPQVHQHLHLHYDDREEHRRIDKR